MAGIPQKHDPGGKVRLAISSDVKSSAVWGGPDSCYRYQLRRTWDETKPHAMFIMMNPSTADETADDRSVAKCERFARTWGVYGGIYVGNTFAYRATNKECKIDLEKVKASLSTPCPQCGYQIPPGEVLRVSSTQVRCPKCGVSFTASAPD
jgi:predicted RNA-binding Zn-ribbon protein involved in translation (DUF1610 family)